MIVVKVTMREGRTDEQKEELHRRLAEAVALELGASLDSVRTVIYEIPPRHWGKAGRSLAAREASG